MAYHLSSDAKKLCLLKFTLANLNSKDPNKDAVAKELAYMEKKVRKSVGRRDWPLLKAAIDGYYNMTYGK